MFDFLMFKRCLSFFFYLFFLCPCRVCRCLFPINTLPFFYIHKHTDTAKQCNGRRGSFGGVELLRSLIFTVAERKI
uniref:Putative secreted protein n=1 Tax=Anopheles marajoara TaxID=58244 RepID=A0A2M4CCY3_9DIPT